VRKYSELSDVAQVRFAEGVFAGVVVLLVCFIRFGT